MRKRFVFCFLLLVCQLIVWAQWSEEEQVIMDSSYYEIAAVEEEISPVTASDVLIESSTSFHWFHFIIIIVVIAVIVFFQIKRFRDTIAKIKVFEDIFAWNNKDYFYGREQDNPSPTKQIFSKHRNPVFNEIKNSINNYLANNKGSVSDYHLMKDIVDRNCDAKEEEINTQIPVPLYLGLVGTMAGILVGIGYLWISGDLSKLLNAGDGYSGAAGVEALLGGVALAMISSILGIVLTTIGSMKAKDAKAEEEKNKHIFLSWMQASLLPNLTNDTAQTLERMSTNLVNFNKSFSKNTSELNKTLSQVNEATTLQKQLLEAVEKLADKNISKQNLDVYRALKNCSEEIGTLGMYLSSSNQYLTAVRELNEKLYKDEKRSQAVERMAAFFEDEVKQVELRKAAISKTVGEIDSQLEEQLRKLGEHASENVEKFYLALGKQQDALQKKLDETQVIVNELKNLSSIKDSISKFEKATAEQNRKIDRLAENIRLLAESKTETGKTNIRIPKWIKVSMIVLVLTSFVICGVLILLALYGKSL